MKIFVIGLCILITMTGCSTSYNNNNTEKWQAELRQLRTEWEQEYTAWKSQNIENYRFIYARIGPWYVVTVRDGVNQSIIDDYSGESYPYEVCPKTINEFFERINNAFNTEEQFSTAQDRTYFSVSYDSQYHYPVEFIRIKYFDQDNGISGHYENIRVWISEFTLLD